MPENKNEKSFDIDRLVFVMMVARSAASLDDNFGIFLSGLSRGINIALGYFAHKGLYSSEQMVEAMGKEIKNEPAEMFVKTSRKLFHSYESEIRMDSTLGMEIKHFREVTREARRQMEAVGKEDEDGCDRT